MSNERVKKIEKVNFASKAAIENDLTKNKKPTIKKQTAGRPSNQLKGSLLGWYAVISSDSFKAKNL